MAVFLSAKKMQWSAHKIPAMVFTTLLVGACSSSDPVAPSVLDDPAPTPTVVDPDNDDRPGLAIEGLNGTPADQLTSAWLANMSFFRLDSRTPGTGDAFLELVIYDESFLVSTHLDFYTPELETCRLLDPTSSGGGDGGGGGPDTVSGGSSVSLNTPTGSWFELQETENVSGVYETNNGLPSAFPEGLTLSIPGDVFPSVAAYPLAEPAPPIRILPTSDILTMDDVTTPFTWMPGDGAPGNYIELVGLSYDDNDDFIGFSIVCNVIDDGSFSMPENIVEAFAATNDNIRARFERVSNRIDFIDGVVFHQRTTVSE
ncbi:MAG: hypothetical protein AB8B79_00085 [Granulosicoccus sp.]